MAKVQESRTQSLEDSVRFLPGVGPVLANELAKIGIRTVRDLLLYLPYRYEDRRHFFRIKEIKPDGSFYQIKATVLNFRSRRSAWRPVTVQQALVKDDSGALVLTWFNQDYLTDLLEKGKDFVFYGKVVRDPRFGLQMVSPDVSKTTDQEISVGRILPVYSLPSRRVSQKKFRKIVFSALERYSHLLPDRFYFHQCWKMADLKLSLEEAIWEVHFPSDDVRLVWAKERLIFEEFFSFCWEVERHKRSSRKSRTVFYELEKNDVLRFYLDHLGFEFTPAQKRAIEEIVSDFKEGRIMHRLLQGDVGSGKTAVALYLSALAVGSGYQVAFMVPTEILAFQHYSKAKTLFPSDRVVLLTSSIKGEEREEVLRRLKEGDAVLAIGTHSLIQPDVQFSRLSLAIIDEQHRFGVRQRLQLIEKCPEVDMLVMTATPIPRSLAMTLYGDLDLTVIDSLPPGRKEVQTIWITSDKRERLYRFLREEVEKGHQVYIVYPLVSESDDLDLLAAEEMYEFLRKEIFPDIELGLIHGKMNSKTKERVMSEFYAGKIKILIATVVIEVGIDVPNATVMVIEHAERFGLSQLHQLRGRIGRGEHESYCIVVSDTSNEETKRRLGAFVKYKDGFRLSEVDLALRGPGEFRGERQHGPTEFRLGNPITDFSILKRARMCVSKYYDWFVSRGGEIWSFLK